MAVVDASLLITALLDRDRRDGLISGLLTANETLHAPEFIDLEVRQTLRRMLHQRLASLEECEGALSNLSALRIQRHRHGDFLRRIWDLRSSMSAYDAAYVALAERLGMRLLTADQRLANAHGSRAAIEFVG